MAILHRFTCIFIAAAAAIAVSSIGANAVSKQVARGKYLVNLADCNDCHTPGYLLGQPDVNRYLGGSDVGFEIPGLGVFVGRNLTPDKETGIGNRTIAQIVTALTTGKLPDGRILAPIMPWHAFAHMTKSDVHDVALFLKGFKPFDIEPLAGHPLPYSGGIMENDAERVTFA